MLCHIPNIYVPTTTASRFKTTIIRVNDMKSRRSRGHSRFSYTIPRMLMGQLCFGIGRCFIQHVHRSKAHTLFAWTEKAVSLCASFVSWAELRCRAHMEWIHWNENVILLFWLFLIPAYSREGERRSSRHSLVWRAQCRINGMKSVLDIMMMKMNRWDKMTT